MSTVATERHIRMAAQLYQARDAARNVLGSRYAEKMADLAAGLQKLATARNTSPLSEAIAAARTLGGFDQVLVLAAVVELTEPTVGAPDGPVEPDPTALGER